MQKNEKKFLFKITVTAMLIALNIILERVFAYTVGNQQIGFSFIAVVFAAVYLGPFYTVAVSALGDILGTVLLSTQGAFFPGFTLTAVVMGLITGFIFEKNVTVPKIVLNTLINLVVCSLLLNTYWLTFFRGAPFLAILIERIPQLIAMPIIQIIVNILVFSEKSAVRRTLDKGIGRLMKNMKI